MANPSASAAKAQIRSLLKEQLEGMTKGEKASSSQEICNRLAHWINARGDCRRISIYSALATEVDLSFLPAALHASFQFSYPLVAGARLQFFRVSDPSELKSGSYGILEPDPAIHEPVSLSDIDLCICPGLAFSPDGTRLRRGKGYYDAMLSGLRPDTPRIGAGFALQIRDSLPREEHDIPMSHLVTEREVMPIRAAAN
ncbi:MAG: 5-formyltetrahydrofolate cyclo-ligase [Roseibacillus sp.]|nr:5-formyltetrahydrofolate cyclo-ligase [Roseibacillus sp.]